MPRPWSRCMMRGSAGTRPRAGRLGGHLVNVRHVLHPFVVVAGLVLAATISVPQASAAPAVRGSVDITSPPQTSSGPTSSLTLSGKATSPTGQVLLSVDGTQTDFPATVGSRGTWSSIRVLPAPGHPPDLRRGTFRRRRAVRGGLRDLHRRARPRALRRRLAADAGGPTLFQVQGSCQDGTDVLISLDGGATHRRVARVAATTPSTSPPQGRPPFLLCSPTRASAVHGRPVLLHEGSASRRRNHHAHGCLHGVVQPPWGSKHPQPTQTMVT